MCAGALCGILMKLLLVVPPLYLVARFVQWSLRQETGTKETES
jgi:hypothetical protein